METRASRGSAALLQDSASVVRSLAGDLADALGKFAIGCNVRAICCIRVHKKSVLHCFTHCAENGFDGALAGEGSSYSPSESSPGHDALL